MLKLGGEVGLEVNVEETKCMAMSCQQNSEQNHNLPIANVFLMWQSSNIRKR